MYPQGPVQDGLKTRLVHIALREHILGDGLAAHAQGRSVTPPYASTFIKLPHRPMSWPMNSP